MAELKMISSFLRGTYCIALICTISFCCSWVTAGEVDSLFAADQEIIDSIEIVETHLNKHISEILNQSANTFVDDVLCEDVALHVMEKLGSTDYWVTKIGALNSSLELWVESNKEIDRIPRYGYDEEIYSKNSIYAPKLKFFGLWSTNVDSTINLGGIYIGTEKLSHFMGSGYEYFKRYLKVKEKVSSKWLAELEVIKWGVEMENTIIGIWSVGVFSYADLEANYQGFSMARDLCGKSILQYARGKWILKKSVDLQSYVGPNWDEAYNPNGYTHNREKSIHKNIEKNDMCKNIDWDTFSQRLSRYDKWHQSDHTESKFPYSSFSSALLTMFQAKEDVDGKGVYTEIVNRYGVTWTYAQLKSFLGTLTKAHEPISPKVLCTDYLL